MTYQAIPSQHPISFADIYTKILRLPGEVRLVEMFCEEADRMAAPKPTPLSPEAFAETKQCWAAARESLIGLVQDRTLTKDELADLFTEDGHLLTQLRQAILNPTNGTCDNIRIFERAVMMVVGFARDTLGDDARTYYCDERSTILLFSNAQQKMEEDGNMDDQPYARLHALDALRLISDTVPVVAMRAFEHRQNNLHNLLSDCAERATSVFNKILKDARAELNGNDSLPLTF